MKIDRSRTLTTSLIFLLLVPACWPASRAAPSAAPQGAPYQKKNLIDALELGRKNRADRQTADWYVTRIRKRKVSFRLTPEDERRIRAAGAYLGARGLEALLEAVRENYYAGPEPPPGTVGPVGPTAAPVCVGKTPPDADYFSVDENYAPTGKMGDIGDVGIFPREDSTVFEYGPEGRGPHEWEYKYERGRLNPTPARFGGVMYLDPPNNFGTRCGGFDLRKFRRAVRWRARSLEGSVNVEFIIGGVEWVWDEEKKAQDDPPFPDSMPRVSLGVKLLTPQWQDFTFDLSARRPDHFARVVSAFAWVMTHRPAGHATPGKPKTFVIEVGQIRYVR